MSHKHSNAERQRVLKNEKNEIPLEKWGPYLSERQWGTVREDYSKNGQAWTYFPHDHARSRVYLWGEDGLGGISDLHQNICFSIALWNEKDPILKERLFGLGNHEGNHGEDVKELYYYLDNTPTHYYMKYLYKYPHGEYPYNQLIQKNAERNKLEPEYEILDTGIFDQGYWDVFIEYAKADSNDIYIKIEVVNRGTERASIWLLPTLWFRNNWQFPENVQQKPVISLQNKNGVKAFHETSGTYYLYFQDANEVLFTENETNFERLFHRQNETEFVKDAFHEAIIHGTNREKLKQKKEGTKCSPVYQLQPEPGKSQTVYLRLTETETEKPFLQGFERIFDLRLREADEFYENLYTSDATPEEKLIQRQALSGMLWNKQYYHYDVERWITHSDGITPVSEERKNGRNCEWKYLKNRDILSMPDKWEYPWYASWDMAFHCITLALVDPLYAKHQIILMMREWYMSPQGQLPAYEWDFSDVNPPVLAFAAYQIYLTEKKYFGVEDIDFLKRVFQKLIINFTWWVNRKDSNGNSIFEGGFLGLDNIGLFNRSVELPGNMILEQADGTSWMGMYAMDMMNIALEIAVHDISFEDAATKFYEHFVLIGEALNKMDLWNDEDKFFYDSIRLNKKESFPLKIRSIVGLSPLFAVSLVEKEVFKQLPDFTKRLKWFQNYRRKSNMYLPGQERTDEKAVLLALVSKKRLQFLLQKLLDESEFYSCGGIRALSKYYEQHPYNLQYEGTNYSIQYDPGDSTSDMFGGNSNWRGPVWMPINYLLIVSVNTFGEFYGDDLKVECPSGSGNFMNLLDVGKDITDRVLSIYKRNENGDRPVFGPYNEFYKREENKTLLLFHEYFHGDTSRGLGASHQTGWTGLLANLILQSSAEIKSDIKSGKTSNTKKVDPKE